MDSDRPTARAGHDPDLEDTQLAESGASTLVSSPRALPLSGSSAPAFGLARGEQEVFPVVVDLSAIPAGGGTRYEAGPVLGSGGMGEVRLIHDQRIGRHVAAKTLHDTSSDGDAARFLREARIQGQLEHPAIVPVYDIDAARDGQPFFTMKRVRGLTLSKILDRLGHKDPETEKRYSQRRLLSALVQVCHAVQFAHERGVVHRDLKPGNIMLGDYGEVYLLDWGVARLLREEEVHPEIKLAITDDAAAGITQAGALVGSLGYMAPEQMRGDQSLVNAPADVFALGVVLYEILTLRKFREGPTLGAILERVSEGERQRPADVRPDVAPELDEICARCTAPKADKRFASAGELAEALESYLEGARDRDARRRSARDLTRDARKRLADPGTTADGRVDALRQVVRALALDPEATDAQALLVESLVEVTGPPPPEADAELDSYLQALRARGSRLGTYGYLSMLLSVPFALWIGVRSWPPVIAMTVLNLCCVALCYYGSRNATRGWQSAVLAFVTGALMAVTSSIAGPFVAVPALAAGITTFFAAHVSARERHVATALITLGAAAGFAVDAFGWFPPGYAFEPGKIVLFARAVEFPKWPMLAALLYSSLSSVALPAMFTGRVHDERTAAQRRMILQAWQLRQLFPGQASTSSAPPPASS